MIRMTDAKNWHCLVIDIFNEVKKSIDAHTSGMTWNFCMDDEFVASKNVLKEIGKLQNLTFKT